MNSRLEKISCYIENGSGFADIGTDHGYLPCVMALRGYKGNIYASDLREGPLNTAISNAEHFKVSDKIEFLLGDGLELCPKDKLDTIVIAGMGGDNICGILDRARWCMDEKYKLILQPMKKAEILRYWLVNKGFYIENEDLVKDGGVVYQLLTARYGKKTSLSSAELFTGSIELIKENPLYPQMLSVQLSRFRKLVAGLKKTSLKQYDAKLKLSEEILSELEEMENEQSM